MNQLKMLLVSSLILASILLPNLSSASTSRAGKRRTGAGTSLISCAGNYLFYHFDVSTKASGSEAVGGMTIVVTQGSTLVRKGTLKIASSNIQPGQSIEFSGADATGGGAVAASFDGLNYTGVLKVTSPQGGANVSVTCVML